MQLSIYQQIFQLTTYKENYSKHLFDFFFIVHVLFGIIYSLLFPKSNYLYPTILHSIFEIYENIFGTHLFDHLNGKIDYTGDSLVNSLGDLSAFLLGVYVGKLINTNYYKKYILILLFFLLAMTIYFLSVKYYYLILI